MATADDNGARVLDQQEVEEVQTGVERWLTSERSTFNDTEPRSQTNGTLPSLTRSGALPPAL